MNLVQVVREVVDMVAHAEQISLSLEIATKKLQMFWQWRLLLDPSEAHMDTITKLIYFLLLPPPPPPTSPRLVVFF